MGAAIKLAGIVFTLRLIPWPMPARLLTDAVNILTNSGPFDDWCIKRANGQWQREMRDYFSEGCWGIHMNGVTPERGVWYSAKDNEPPERVMTQGKRVSSGAWNAATATQSKKKRSMPTP